MDQIDVINFLLEWSNDETKELVGVLREESLRGNPEIHAGLRSFQPFYFMLGGKFAGKYIQIRADKRYTRTAAKELAKTFAENTLPMVESLIEFLKKIRLSEDIGDDRIKGAIVLLQKELFHNFVDHFLWPLWKVAGHCLTSKSFADKCKEKDLGKMKSDMERELKELEKFARDSRSELNSSFANPKMFKIKIKQSLEWSANYVDLEKSPEKNYFVETDSFEDEKSLKKWLVDYKGLWKEASTSVVPRRTLTEARRNDQALKGKYCFVRVWPVHLVSELSTDPHHREGREQGQHGGGPEEGQQGKPGKEESGSFGDREGQKTKTQ